VRVITIVRFIQKQRISEIWGTRSGLAEDSDFLVCNSVSCEWVMTFRRAALPSKSRGLLLQRHSLISVIT
jgi:hypothetical protein